MTRDLAIEVDRLCESVPAKEWRELYRLDQPRFYKHMREWMRSRMLLSFSYFLWYGIYWHARKHYRGELFQKMAHWHEHDQWDGRTKFLIVAREHCKTQTLIAHAAWRFAGDVNRRLLIRAYNTPKAEQIGRGLKELLDTTRYRTFFPWVRPKMRAGSKQRELWGSSGIMLDRGDVGLRVPSVEVCGMEKDPTGGHFTDQKCDDFALRDNEMSDVLRADLYDVFKSDNSLMLPGAQREIAGTIWARDGFMDSAAKRTGHFADMDYDLFFAPGEYEFMPTMIFGDELRMLDDRKTFVIQNQELPADLKHAQLRLTFENPDLTDTDVIIREIEHSDKKTITVTRPIETVYTGQLLAYNIGNTKPAAPTRFTLDCVDILAPPSLSDIVADRASLYKKRRDQGPYMYGCNVLLSASPKDSCLFNSDKVQSISMSDFNQLAEKEKGVWFRKCDLASAKKTRSFTAITIGFVTFRGVFVRKIAWGNLKSHEILLEMFRGHIWLKQTYNASLRHTQFETANIENTLQEPLNTAMRNPYEYLSLLGGKCRAFAEKNLKNVGPIYLPIATVSRRVATTKMDRIRHKLDPVLEQERLYIVEGIEHEDRAYKEIREATLEDETGFDLLETISDLCEEIRPSGNKSAQPQNIQDLYGTIRRGALMDAARATLGALHVEGY